MFNWLRRDPTKKLQAMVAKKLEEARDAQRGGDMARFAALTEESERLAAELDRLTAKP